MNRRATDKLLDDTILNLHAAIVRLDQHHFPDRVAESRLDKFIQADQLRRKP